MLRRQPVLGRNEDVIGVLWQGEGRIEKLFKEKSCHRVLQSVDKSNDMVNNFCIFVVFVCMLVFISAVGNVFV